MNELRFDKRAGPRVQAGRLPSGAARRWPLFGGWLPLLALYDPPCRRDGSPWDGRGEPGFRITTLALGWLGHGVSVTLGAPRPLRSATPDPAGERAAISALDERIRQARARAGSPDEAP